MISRLTYLRLEIQDGDPSKSLSLAVRDTIQTSRRYMHVTSFHKCQNTLLTV